MSTSQNDTFQSFLPLYDAVPEEWEQAKPFIVEVFKRIATTLNIREVGYYLDEEVLTGKQFYPTSGNPQEFRSIFRKVIPCTGGLVAGNNSFAHGLIIDVNFTLVDMWCAASNSSTFVGTIFCNDDTINYDVTNINIDSDGTYDRANIFIEYTQEI